MAALLVCARLCRPEHTFRDIVLSLPVFFVFGSHEMSFSFDCLFCLPSVALRMLNDV